MAKCEHDNDKLICPSCAADAKATGGDALAAWLRAKADAACDARFPRRYVQAVADVPGVLAWVGKFAANPDEAPSLLIAGPTGVGKTYQAYGAVREAMRRRPTATWEATTFADFCAALRPGGKDPEGTLARYKAAGLLLVDDLGTAKSSEWVEETTYRLINHRYEAMLPSIFTTNLPIAQLRDGVGDRISSRLAEICDRVPLLGNDRRRAA